MCRKIVLHCRKSLYAYGDKTMPLVLKGKSYAVVDDGEQYVLASNEIGCRHVFSKETYHKWFEIEPINSCYSIFEKRFLEKM